MKVKNFWEWDFMENAGRSIAEVTDEGIEINIISEIGGGWWSENQITKDTFLSAMKGNYDKPVTVNISSLGGDVDTALYINTLLSKHKDVTVFYSGIVASAATWLGSNGKRIADPSTVFMIHESGSWADGTKQDMRAAEKVLSIIDNSIFGLYSAITGRPVSYFQEQIDNNGGEWWLNANEALEIGLIHEIKAFEGAITDVQPMPKNTAKQFQITNKLYIMNEKSILEKIKNLLLGGGDEGEGQENKPTPVVKNELNADERAELNELRARVDELEALIARFTADAEAKAETENELKTQVENLKKQVTAASIQATTERVANKNQADNSTMSDGAKKLLSKYGKYLTK
jgi:ATP-dependent protease ClpP protease subunit